jgi:hypothetical protein
MEQKINQLADNLNELVDIPNLTEQQEYNIILLFITLLIFAIKIFFT